MPCFCSAYNTHNSKQEQILTRRMDMKQKHKPYTSCIIAAGGSGSRMGAEINKIFLELCDIPVLAHTLLAFEQHPDIHEIILVARECDIPGCMDIAEEFHISKLKAITRGGNSRQESVINGMKEISEHAEAVLIHDAARPLVSADVIASVIENALAYGGAAVGSPCKNTIKEINQDGYIVRTADRDFLYEAQTPQGFRTENARQMYRYALAHNISGTDDCFLAEQLGFQVKMVCGSSDNLKITTYDDLLLATQIFNNRKEKRK